MSRFLFTAAQSDSIFSGGRSSRRQRLRQTGLSCALLCLAGLSPAFAVSARSDIADLSIEELANIKVTSVSKKTESLSDAPASIFVITGEDIRRSGAASLPEALRLAPNLQVARVDARNYAITARGFNSPFENKLLVLIDGRTVYTPLFSGVFWDAQDVMLADVERIEVISGPGATLWGANAVNGVINITTRTASSTQGGLVETTGDSLERAGAMRYGGALGNGGHYRVYAKYADSDDTKSSKGVVLPTGWHRNQIGFRTDWDDAKGGALTLQGDAYQGQLHQFGTRDIEIGGTNLLGRVNRTLAGGSDISAQVYVDHTQRDQPGAFIEHLDTIDVELQHTLQLATRHSVVWGGGYRLARDRVVNDKSFAFLPGSLNMHWANLFVQDEIALKENLRLTLGEKIENNGYTGNEFLPSARLAWKPAAEHLLWASASRAVRVPSRIDHDFFSPAQPVIVNGVPRYLIAGGPDFVSEVANVVELGYRGQPAPTMSYSVTAFYSDYDKLRTLEPNPGKPCFVFSNKSEGIMRGLEFSGNWQVLKPWRLTGGLVLQKLDTSLMPGSADISGATGIANNDPHSYWTLRSLFDISEDKELDVSIRHMARLPQPAVPAYTAVDVRLGWKPRRDLELALVAQNLSNPPHTEFGAEPGRSVFDRSVLIKIEWRI